MSKNKNLQKAKANKQDEFYTQLVDIEKEMKYYRKHFKDKVILCNCDDPYESNFFKYFAINFNRLKLKKLICIGYEDSPIAGDQVSIFDNEETKPAHVLEINEVKDWNEDGRTDLSDVEWLLKNDKNVYKELKGNGDFRSPESIEYLKEADIVVTNPPFSLFREYIEQLINYNKKFIVLGSQNAITYKEIFPLIKENKLWLGHYSGDMSFKTPPYYKPRKTRYWEDESGQKWRSFGNINWYTNIDHKGRHEKLILYKKYEPENYPKYNNYNAINIDKVKNIPFDYDGLMGVPITFLNKFNPDQFKLLGLTCTAETMDSPVQLGADFVNEYRRQGGTGHISANMYGVCFYDKEGNAKVPFGRIIIKRK